MEIRVTMAFEEENGKSSMTLYYYGITSEMIVIARPGAEFNHLINFLKV